MNTFEEMEKLVDKWDKTGMLDKCMYLSDKIQLSDALEEMADNILHKYNADDSSDDDKTKCGILIPMVVRAFYQGARIIDIDKMINIVDELFPKLQQMEDDAYNRIDGEAEFMIMCVDKYIIDVFHKGKNQ